VPISLVHSQKPYPCIWRSYKRPMCHTIPRHWQAWLQDKGSLTQRLIHASDGHFSVRVVSNRWGIPSQSEAEALMLKPRQKAIIREVELLCHNQVWVCARSIIPHSTLRGRLRQFKNIGTKPLGALLFKHPNMIRGALEVTSLQQVNSHQQHWARRSVFYLDGKGILVTEVFMPPMASVLPQDD
jgi:chorismate--pyruvate lyase